jgi:hypothetical protein
MLKTMKKLAALALVVGCLGQLGACAYAGVAAAPDGTVYVARNDALLFGLLRKLYACKPSGASVACSEVPAP